ncbi:hypothetical protein DPMN_084636 [Dreissena polymorpha]|uniref:Uncharacterized protein n=1 Tax=Dreissena polymorpha TaxID=45954 RepID=A0A9D4BL27_DREPO|nr:hypothetical protein DPMN_084636 [Dreissena polymorpha]
MNIHCIYKNKSGSICKDYGRRSFRYAAPVLWNSLPDEFRQAGSFSPFKTLISVEFFTEVLDESVDLFSEVRAVFVEVI